MIAITDGMACCTEGFIIFVPANASLREVLFEVHSGRCPSLLREINSENGDHQVASLDVT